jgi:hypothetical protein
MKLSRQVCVSPDLAGVTGSPSRSIPVHHVFLHVVRYNAISPGPRVEAVWRPHAAGVYANFLSDEGAPGVEETYGDRLRALKDRYDPTNVFRLNANIRPSRDGNS